MDVLLFHANLPFAEDPDSWKASTLASLTFDPITRQVFDEHLASKEIDLSYAPLSAYPPRLLYLYVRAAAGLEPPDPSAAPHTAQGHHGKSSRPRRDASASTPASARRPPSRQPSQQPGAAVEQQASTPPPGPAKGQGKRRPRSRRNRSRQRSRDGPNARATSPHGSMDLDISNHTSSPSAEPSCNIVAERRQTQYVEETNKTSVSIKHKMTRE